MIIHREQQIVKLFAILFCLTLIAAIFAISYRDFHSIWGKGEWLFFTILNVTYILLLAFLLYSNAQKTHQSKLNKNIKYGLFVYAMVSYGIWCAITLIRGGDPAIPSLVGLILTVIFYVVPFFVLSFFYFLLKGAKKYD